jgi:hypothetical protein
MEDASKMVLENKRNASTQNGDTPVELVGDGKDIMSILRQFGIGLLYFSYLIAFQLEKMHWPMKPSDCLKANSLGK